ncbi:hypothetical protein [Rhodanobacter lindaniclasticus]
MDDPATSLHNPADVEGGPLAGAINRHAKVAWKTGTSYGYRERLVDRHHRPLDHRRVDRPPRRHPVARPVRRRWPPLPLLFQIVDMLRARRACAGAAGHVGRGLLAARRRGRPTDPALCRQRRRAGAAKKDDALPRLADVGAWSSGLLTPARRRKGTSAVPRPVQLARWPALATPWLSVDDRARSALPPLRRPTRPIHWIVPRRSASPA